MTTNTLDSVVRDNPFRTRLDSTAPINEKTRIISRSSPSNGTVTYTLQIGSVSVPDVSLAEVTDYVSEHDLEVFENQTFENDIKEEELRQKQRLAEKAQARRHNRFTDPESSSESSSPRARSISGAPLSGNENVRATAGGRQRPSYTHFYPKQRAPRGSLKSVSIRTTAEPRTKNSKLEVLHLNACPADTVEADHRDSKRRRLREDRDGSTSSAQDADSVHPYQPPSAMEQAAGLISDAHEDSDLMELDDESDNDIDMPIRQPAGMSNTAEKAVRDKGKGSENAFFTFRDVPPVASSVARNPPLPLSAKAKLVASLTQRQAPVASARETPKASTLPASASASKSLHTTDTTKPSANNPVHQAVANANGPPDADSGSDSEDSEVFAVEKILAHGLSDPKSHDKSVHGEKPVMLYHVKWEGYDETTWEPATSFQDTTVLQEYWIQQAQKHKQKQKPPA